MGREGGGRQEGGEETRGWEASRAGVGPKPRQSSPGWRAPGTALWGPGAELRAGGARRGRPPGPGLRLQPPVRLGRRNTLPGRGRRSAQAGGPERVAGREPGTARGGAKGAEGTGPG